MRTTRVFGITGLKNSGKTTLVCRLIPILRQRGLRVATIKHTHHDVAFDTPGKDSHAHQQAGAERVLIASRQRMAIFEEYPNSEELELDRLLMHFSDMDLVLVEGFKHARHPKLQVMRADNHTDQALPGVSHILALACGGACACPYDSPLPQFDLDDIETIADLILLRAKPY